jgi:hypothetical protein
MAQKVSVLGIDIAKLVFHVVGMNDSGHVVLRKRIARAYSNQQLLAPAAAPMAETDRTRHSSS